MKKRYRLGHVGDLEVTAEASVALGGISLWALFSLVSYRLFKLNPALAVLGGAVAAAFHFLSELVHQLGHARAASRTGYPMQRLHLWGVLGTSVYPPEEPALPEEVHIARALGGPRTSIWLALLGGLFAWAAAPFSRFALMVAALFGLENLFIFTIGALLPMPFLETDGETIMRYRRAHRRRNIVIQD